MSVIKHDPHTPLYNLAARIPNELINIDTLDIGREDEYGFKHVIVMIDCFTRWVNLYPIKSLTGEEATDVIINHFNEYGAPVAVKTDNGTQFVNEKMEFVNKYYQVWHNVTIPHRHEENGMVERANKEVLRHLRAYLFDNRISNRWSKALSTVQRILNTTTHSITGFTPAELRGGPAGNLGRYINDKNPLLAAQSGHIPSSIQIQHEMHNAILELAQNLQQEANELHLKDQRGEPVAFPEGDYVLVNYPWSYKGNKPPSKLLCNKKEPMKIMEVDRDEYTVQDCISKDIQHVHVSRLSPFYYDPTKTDPEKIAYLDKGAFEVEKIIGHFTGNSRNKSEWDFLVRWKGYDS